MLKSHHKTFTLVKHIKQVLIKAIPSLILPSCHLEFGQWCCAMGQTGAARGFQMVLCQ